MSSPGAYSGQSCHDLALQIQQHSSGPQLVISGHEDAGNTLACRPLPQKMPARIEDFDSPGFAVRDINRTRGIDRYIVG